MVVIIVALLVVGPKKMPETIRSILLTIGRMKRLFNNAREELEKQVSADDIRQQLHNENVMEKVEKNSIDYNVEVLNSNFSEHTTDENKNV